MSNLQVEFINNKWRPQVKRFGTWKDILDMKGNLREFRNESDAWRIIEAFDKRGRWAAYGWKARRV